MRSSSHGANGYHREVKSPISALFILSRRSPVKSLFVFCQSIASNGTWEVRRSGGVLVDYSFGLMAYAVQMRADSSGPVGYGRFQVRNADSLASKGLKEALVVVWLRHRNDWGVASR
jgi:hypothetical protein